MTAHPICLRDGIEREMFLYRPLSSSQGLSAEESAYFACVRYALRDGSNLQVRAFEHIKAGCCYPVEQLAL